MPGIQLTFLPTRKLVRHLAADSVDPRVRYIDFEAFVELAYTALGDGRPVVGELARDRAIRKLIADHAAARPQSLVAHWRDTGKRGLLDALVARLPEFKRLGLPTAGFREGEAPAEPQSPDSADPAIDASLFDEIAALHARYRTEVRDADDREWVVAGALASGSPLPVSFAGVAGIAVEHTDRLTPGQRTLLAALVSRGLALRFVWPLEPELVSRLDPLAEQQRWLESLARDHQVEITFAPPAPPSALDLDRLRRNLFAYAPPAPARDASVRLIRAPDRLAECDALARLIRTLLREQPDLQPADIAVAPGDPAFYRPLLFARFERAGIPYFSRRGTSLAQQPLYRHVRKLLGLAPSGFPARDVLACVQSSYSRFGRTIEMGDPPAPFRIDAGRIELLFSSLDYNGSADSDSLRKRLTRRAVETELSKQEVRDQADPLDPAATARRLADLDRRLARERRVVEELDSHLAPLSGLGAERDPVRLSSRVAALVDRFTRIGDAETSEPDRRCRDLLRRVFDELAADHPAGATVAYVDWLAELDALAGKRALIDVGDPQGVQIVGLPELSGFRFPVVVVPGLLHGSFPALDAVDPLLNEDEQLQIADALARAGHPVGPVGERAAWNHRIQFARAVGAADRLLVLSVPVTEQTQEQNPPGEFHSDAEFLFRPAPDLPTTLPLTVAAPSHIPPDPGDALCMAELHTHVAAGSPSDPQTAGLHRALAEAEPIETARWTRAASIERKRGEALAAGRATEWSGLFGSSATPIRDRCVHESGDLNIRGTDLETFGKCPFRFVLESVLNLRPLTVPREDFDLLAKGRLLHRVLERFYRDPARRAALPSPQAHLGVLSTLADEELARFAPSAASDAAEDLRLLAAELRQRLESFLHADRAFRVEAMSEPVMLEHPFAAVPAVGVAPPVRLTGRIDRVDRTADGRPVIVDYKTSAVVSNDEDFFMGTRVQLGVYALALESLPEGSLAAAGWNPKDPPRDPRAAYFALRRRRSEIAQPLRVFDDGAWRHMMLGHIKRFAAAVAGAAFPAFPTDDACRFCGHASVCKRTDDTAVRRGPDAPSDLDP